MTSKDIVKDIMKLRGHTYESLAEKLGFKHASGLSERLRPGAADMRIDTLLKMLDAMDCELVIRSKMPKEKAEWTVEGK